MVRVTASNRVGRGVKQTSCNVRGVCSVVSGVSAMCWHRLWSASEVSGGHGQRIQQTKKCQCKEEGGTQGQLVRPCILGVGCNSALALFVQQKHMYHVD